MDEHRFLARDGNWPSRCVSRWVLRLSFAFLETEGVSLTYDFPKKGGGGKQRQAPSSWRLIIFDGIINLLRVKEKGLVWFAGSFRQGFSTDDFTSVDRGALERGVVSHYPHLMETPVRRFKFL
jgi:hypothetical protein